MSYTPSQQVLERYADVLVNFALGGGAGISRGDVVRIAANEAAKPLYAELHRAVWRAGGHTISAYSTDDDASCNLSRDFYEIAGDEQVDFFASAYMRGMVDQIDHWLSVLSDADMHALEGVDPSLLMRTGLALKPFIDWRVQKENAGHMTWTLGLYGTPAMAAEAGLSEEDYWQQIIYACFLDEEDPIARWREVSGQIQDYTGRLNSLDAESLHIEGEDVDLRIRVGESRKWVGGSGRNIPSFEVFTSPDWRGTEGRIRFSEPLYAYGSLITGVELEFEHGLVVAARADQNQPLLEEMVATDGANRVGEFSLTDAGLSRISRFMANTLFDENTGGPYGNTHLAVGLSIRQCYDGDPAQVSDEEWERLGFNDSVVHTDIVSTTDRTVTAILKDGSERVIYTGGHFAAQ